MKRINILIIAALVAISAALGGCEDIEEIFKTDKANIQISVTDYSVSNGNVSIPGNINEVEVVVQINAPGKIKEISIKKSGSNISGFPKTGGFDSETNHSAKWTVQREKTDRSKEVFTFSVSVIDMDTEPKEESATITVTFEEVPPPVEEQGGDINTWENRSLGSLIDPVGAAGSSFSSSDGIVYTIGNAGTNSAKIDFIYYILFGAHTVSSPNTTKAHSASVNGWSTKRTTKLQKVTTITSSQFDAIQKDKLIVDNVSSTSSESVTSLAAGDVIGFITDGGKKGLIKVNSVNSPANHINITVKIQK